MQEPVARVRPSFDEPVDDKSLAARQFVELCLAGMDFRAHLQIGRADDAEIERTVTAGVRLFLAGYKPTA